MLVRAGLAVSAGALGFGRRALRAASAAPSSSPARPAPNIVIIMADDMGYGDPGCYNRNSKIPTPNMDKLASTGMRFTDAHSASAVCSPSRYGLLTGRYCWRTRLKRGVLGGYGPPLIEPSRLTIASMLKQQNYTTGCIGKWHVGAQFQTKEGKPTTQEKLIDFSKPIKGGPCAVGFDYAFFTAGCVTCAPPYGFIENDHFVDKKFSFYNNRNASYRASCDSGMMGASWQTKQADVTIAKKAREFIKDCAVNNKRFFLYLTPSAPHEPCATELVPEFARGKSKAGARGDLVWLFDWIVGQVTETLKQTGQAGNTLIIVTSDNGALPGTFVLDSNGRKVAHANRNYVFKLYGHKSCGDLRGYKSHIWDGGHRIPMIACWPGKIAPTTVSDELICLTDILATCAAIVGYDLPNNAAEDSYNMLPVLLGGGPAGRRAGRPVREAVIHHSGNGVFAIRQGKWKLIVETKGSGGWPPPRGGRPQPGTPGQLYDVSADPAEQEDLWEKRPDIVARLRNLLDQYKQTGRSAPIRE